MEHLTASTSPMPYSSEGWFDPREEAVRFQARAFIEAMVAAELQAARGTVITMLERAGVPEGTVQDVVGHERSTLTGSTYSGKSKLEMKTKALAKLAY